MTAKKSIIILFLVITASISSAQKDSIKKSPDSTRFFKKVGHKITAKRNWLLGIMLNRTPETGFLTGLHYMQLFRMSKDTNLRISDIDFTLSYTQKKQAIVMLNNTLYFKNGKYILRGINAYKKWNEYFWGIGNEALESNKQLVNFNMKQFSQRFSRAITTNLFAGIQYQYFQVSEVSSPDEELLDSMAVAGSEGSLTSGIGAHILYDSRDNVINAYKGFYLDISNYINNKHFGSNFSFNNFTIDARKYIQILPRQIIALQAIADFNWGNVPFRQLAGIGGEKIMRGYTYGRYRDMDMIECQAEYRFPVWKFIGLCVFGSCGEVANKINQFNTHNILFAGGAGLRIMWIKHQRLNMIFDLGIGKNTSGSYGGSGEVF